jgi:putative oxidoreductase
MWRKLIATRATWVAVPLRIALGLIFIGHGGSKVFGWFGGPGLVAWSGFPVPFAFMRPAWLWMGAAAVSELIGGLLILTGLTTRVGAFLVSCVMLTAMFGIHWGAFFLPKGIEFCLALLGLSIALLITGGGMASMDRMLMDARDRRR